MKFSSFSRSCAKLISLFGLALVLALVTSITSFSSSASVPHSVINQSNLSLFPNRIDKLRRLQKSTQVLGASLILSQSSNPAVDGNRLEVQGKKSYQLQQIPAAISHWQNALEIYQENQAKESQARVLAHLALAYLKLGQISPSQTALSRGFNLLSNHVLSPTEQKIKARLLNVQGALNFRQGNSQLALENWQTATEIYQQIEDIQGEIKSLINQSQALSNLGLNRRAAKTLERVQSLLDRQPNSLVKATGLKNYGMALSAIGKLDKSYKILQQSRSIALEINSPSLEIAALQALAENARYRGEQAESLNLSEQAWQLCQQVSACRNSHQAITLQLSFLNHFVLNQNWQSANEQWLQIKQKWADFQALASLSDSINLAYNLYIIKEKSNTIPLKLKNIPTWSEIANILVNTIAQARQNQDKRTESYGLGTLGKIYLANNQLKEAETITQQAFWLASELQAPEIIYLWQWQLGKIYKSQNNRTEAIRAYQNAVETLKSVQQNLVTISEDLRFSFQTSVEPVYRELIALLLSPDKPKRITQSELRQVLDTIELLKVAELHNFFKEACLDVVPQAINEIDKGAAVIYPIILPHSLEIILSLPDKQLLHYSQAINSATVEKTIKELRKGLVIRSKRLFYQPARQLHDWIIRPLEEELAVHQIKTLVFVPDGVLQNIPMATLYDGKQYLIEKYSVAFTPGLRLLSPTALQTKKLKAITVGISESLGDFPPLEYVNQELTAIKQNLPTSVLLNEEFTQTALQKKIEHSDSPIVHIATHGQFSSTLEETFLLAWDSRINITDLDNILQKRRADKANAIELLVLSACQTATGDKKATLGLAGMAVRAGARSTLATLWSVNDEATTQLMINFYQELNKTGVSKAEAIQRAQLKLLKNQWYEHPFYWAPYILVGNWL
ncbi:MAG: CHAT domain-containing protein [Cyanobacteria bacterium J083]|nr:MAG: CHAT domain-containing protein [Cyanobacteria bacterium J083]